MVKPSTVLIMQKAKDYIDLLRRTIQEMEVEINDLRRALVAAGYPLPMPSHQQQVVCGFPGSQPASFNSSCQSPRLLPEQLLNVSQQLGMEQSLSFQGLGELGIGSAHFDPQEIENINRLHSVLSKGSMDMVSSSGRPLSPVSPYQLDQSHGCSSGEFKKQPHALHSSGSGVLGTHV
ncbi:hypothetical protein EC988_003817 [Linderina pennispora]|nr:hypothetical protein EC988_003817 [Linderina pennispora]